MFSFLLAANILKNSQGFFAACRFKFYMIINYINRFHAGLFQYPLKTSEIQRFSDVFRGYRMRPVAWNGLTEKVYFR